MPYTYKELMDIEIAVEAARNAARAMGNDRMTELLGDATYIIAEIRLTKHRLSIATSAEDRQVYINALNDLFERDA